MLKFLLGFVLDFMACSELLGSILVVVIFKVCLRLLKDIWLLILALVSPLRTIGAVQPVLLLPNTKWTWFTSEWKLNGSETLQPPALLPHVLPLRILALHWDRCIIVSFLRRDVLSQLINFMRVAHECLKILLLVDVLQMLVCYLEVKNHCEDIHLYIKVHLYCTSLKDQFVLQKKKQTTLTFGTLKMTYEQHFLKN